MKSTHQSLLVFITSLTAGVGSAYGAQPTDVVSSDSNANTAMGQGALLNFIGGYYNTASGAYALNSDTSGGSNTASGAAALELNTTGGFNTAVGAVTLFRNDYNNASGYFALRDNTTGSQNSASGKLWSASALWQPHG
jgi:hypothetical protein